MRIAVNTRLLLPGKLEGIGWFTAETIKRITRAHPEHRFLFLFDRAFPDEFIFSDNIEPVIVHPQARHPFLWYAWFECSLPVALKKQKADFFLSPDGYLSLSSKVPSLAVIHDLNFMHRPGDLPWLTRNYYRHFFPAFAEKAVRIATVSEYSRNDICNTLGTGFDKTDVVYNGAGEIYRPLPEEEKIQVRKEYARDGDYFLYVGSLQKRKNITGLLEAYDSFRNTGGAPLKLVITGEKKFGYGEMGKIIAGMRFGHDLVFTGRKEPAELRRLYGAAFAFVYIPFFEGFGIPVLEAMNCGTPVIASNLTSIPEVAGDAALLVDPGSVKSVVEAMHRITSDDKFRSHMIVRSRDRIKLFSWDRTADLLWNSMEKSFSDANI